ncbi:MAG: hypothetical protein ACI4M5_02875 [Christensenellales bacterium]
MYQRYEIIEEYNGLFDSKIKLCTTDSLTHALYIVKTFEKAYEDNPCYSYDFKKIATDLDESLDFYPDKSFLDSKVIDCKSMQDFLEKLNK